MWGRSSRQTLSCHKMIAAFARTFQCHANAPDASMLNLTAVRIVFFVVYIMFKYIFFLCWNMTLETCKPVPLSLADHFKTTFISRGG